MVLHRAGRRPAADRSGVPVPDRAAAAGHAGPRRARPRPDRSRSSSRTSTGTTSTCRRWRASAATCGSSCRRPRRPGCAPRGSRTPRRSGSEAPVVVGGVTVEAVPARHSAFRPPRGPRRGPLGYVIRGSRTIYFAGDTDLFDGMADLGTAGSRARPGLGLGADPWARPAPGSAARRRGAPAPAPARRRSDPLGHLLATRDGPRLRREPLVDPPRQFAALAAEIAPTVTGADDRGRRDGRPARLVDVTGTAHDPRPARRPGPPAADPAARPRSHRPSA